MDDFEGLGEVVDVDGNEGVFWEVVGDVGAAVVEGEGEAEEGVGDFLGPVVWGDVVFDGEVVLVGVKGVCFVVDEADAVAEDVEL